MGFQVRSVAAVDGRPQKALEAGGEGENGGTGGAARQQQAVRGEEERRGRRGVRRWKVCSACPPAIVLSCCPPARLPPHLSVCSVLSVCQHGSVFYIK